MFSHWLHHAVRRNRCCADAGAAGGQAPANRHRRHQRRLCPGCPQSSEKSGFRVPQDIALTGCDNLFFTQYLDPPLTTVDLRATERGSFAMEELINALNGGDTTPISHKLECSLIVRESCGAMLGRERFR